jgi:putative glutamine amidotransferase
MKIPLIGITADSDKISGQPSFIIKESYVAAVEDSGGVPFLLCPVRSEAAVSSFVSLIDGLLISGGGFDIDPKLYGEEPHPGLGKTLPDRTDFEIKLLREAVEKKVPILGICGGHQLINVYFGGTLYQDIPSQYKGAINHKQPTPSDNPYHSINIYPSTRLLRIAGTDSTVVNSTHHQSIKKIGNNLKISSVAEDGIIEAIEYDGDDFIVGVQWHPERLYSKEPASQKIFADFIKEAEKFRIKKGSNR